MQTAIKVKSFPDLGRQFQILKIQDKLREIPPITLYGTIIRWGVDNKPIAAVCKLILEQFAEDPSDVLHAVGQETIDLIKSVYEKAPA